MKKAFVWILFVVLLITCSLPSVVAETVEEAQPKYIDILNCETADGFTSIADIAVDTEDFTEGASSLSFTASIPKEAGATGSIEATFAPIDISYATVLEFDFYISDPALLRSTYIMTVDLGSAGKPDECVLDWPSTAFDSITEPGWYHVQLPFDEAVNLRFDASALNYFRLYFMNVCPEEDLTDVVIKLDNVRARIPATTTVAMENCDFLNEGDWSNWMNNPVTRDPVNRTEGTSSLDLGFIYTEQYGGWSMVCEKKYAPINATNAVFLEMDVYVSDVARMGNSQYASDGINIEITSSGTCDVNEYSWPLCDYVTKNGWTHIRLPIAQADVYRGVPDMSAINYLRFHILGVREGSIVFKIDNIYFTVMQDAQALFYGSTPIVREEETPDDPNLPDVPGETPPVENPPADTDSTLRAQQTSRRAKILVLVMIFAIVGIDVVVVSVRRRNEKGVPVEGDAPVKEIAPVEEIASVEMPQDGGEMMAKVQRFLIVRRDTTHELTYTYSHFGRNVVLEIDGERFELPKGERQEPFILDGEQAILCIARDGRASIIVREGEVTEQ